MATAELFSLALGLQDPWKVTEVKFDPANKRLDLTLDFRRGSKFICPVCQQTDCAVHDTQPRTWRHLNFFQYEAYITARVPRVDCKQCGIKQVNVPWARPGSGFTLLFESIILMLAQHMSVFPLSRIINVHPDSIWRVLKFYVAKAHAVISLDDLRHIGLDELSKEKGHRYVSVFGDLDKRRIFLVAETREGKVISELKDHLISKGVALEQIEGFCIDMWPAYIQGLNEDFSQAEITFDRYHVISKVNRAVDLVRRQEVKEREELKKTKYLWLTGPANLTKKQHAQLETLSQLNLKTDRARRIRDALNEMWTLTDREQAEKHLKKWYFWATHSRLPAIIKVAKTIKNHWDGILSYIDSQMNNGSIEGLNGLIRTAIRRAYGFRTFENLQTVIYLVAGKLRLPTLYC